jgi:putative DNA primase/helicase
MTNNQPPITITNDGKLTIATGKSRKETKWRNTSIKWSNLLSRLRETKHTHETFEEYKSLPKEEQDNIKDVGGFVGGTLKEERRRRDTVADRCLVTLDLDYAKPGLWEKLNSELDYAFCIYSTHKHSPEKPRLRLLIPLSRPVTPEEYEAVTRKLAQEIGMEYFDPTSFEPSRLMYWPSTSSDGTYDFHYKDEKWLDPNKVLETYEDWRDISSWPSPKNEVEITKKPGSRQENPREKTVRYGATLIRY